MATQARALRTDPRLTWDGLAMKMATASREPSKEDFLDRMNRLEADLLRLVSIITELAARQFGAWPNE